MGSVRRNGLRSLPKCSPLSENILEKDSVLLTLQGEGDRVLKTGMPIILTFFERKTKSLSLSNSIRIK